MSIWASFGGIDKDYRSGEPIVYRGSHLFPDEKDRGGSVDIALIPGHVRFYRENPNSESSEPTGVEPWLRLSVNDGTVILDREQVKALVFDLNWWLKETGKSS